MLDMLMPLYTRIIDTLLPKTCVFCGQSCQTEHAICLPCYQKLPVLSHTCYSCAKEIPTNQTTCGPCLLEPPPFTQTFALFPYTYPIAELIVQLKFQHKLTHAHTLGKLMHKKIGVWYKDQALPDVIIPVPLHIDRLTLRGFNQALEIAKYIARLLQIKLDTTGVMRSKATLAQSQLSIKAREQNLKNAFIATQDYTGLHVVILDDVVTTGNTVHTLSKVLIQAGAKRVDIWCCARRL